MEELKVNTGVAADANLKENTLTFKMDEPITAKAGRFAIVEIQNKNDIGKIKAAPALLEVLQELLTIINGSEGVCGGPLNRVLWDELLGVHYARQAINKALGV